MLGHTISETLQPALQSRTLRLYNLALPILNFAMFSPVLVPTVWGRSLGSTFSQSTDLRSWGTLIALVADDLGHTIALGAYGNLQCLNQLIWDIENTHGTAAYSL